MPGPGKKHKSKGHTKSTVLMSTTPDGTSTTQCYTLEEDEMTRCDQPATEGYPKPDRCKVHHGQYRIMYKKYKEASQVVDEIRQGATLPTKEQIARYTDWHTALEKSRWVQKYLEAIRVERKGRVIHQKRFFLKADDGHKLRLKILQKEMVKAIDAFDALQARAAGLYRMNGPLHGMNEMMDPPLPVGEDSGKQYSRRTTEELVEMGFSVTPSFTGTPSGRLLTAATTSQAGDEDLIDLSIRAQKEDMLKALEPFINLELFITLHNKGTRPLTDNERSMLEKQFFIHQQFARRIILHEPTLFMKSLDKVSFKDLVLGDNFSIEDLLNFSELFMRPLEFPLKWFKDAVLDALAMSHHGNAANVGKLDSRFPLLGGWVYNRAHTTPMTNEAWWHLLKTLEPPANVENRFVRLCNTFDDIIAFLSFETLGFIPSPSFCKSVERFDFEDPSLSRNHLSLCGVIVADMVATGMPPQMRRPIPTTQRAKKRGCIVWSEMETRAYLFGAIRNDPDDAFTNAFIRELRARPDLFQVVLRSETSPGHEVETFGSGPSSSEVLPAIRVRSFEAPPSPATPSPPVDAKWQVMRSAVDVLYGTGKELQGYLTILARDLRGWFFRFKNPAISVKFFVILDAIANRDRSILARNVAWAALRAGGYGEGEYTLRKYAVATDRLFERCAEERLGWLPKEFGWVVTKMEDQVNAAAAGLGRE